MLDACSSDAALLPSCLACVIQREAILMTNGRRGGSADRPTTHFIDWSALSNPVLQDPDRLMKNQAMIDHDGWFYVFAPNTLRRTRDFLAFESIDVPGGRYFGDLTAIGGVFYQTTNGNVGDNVFEIFARTSPDMLTWTPLESITPDLWPNSIIDGALTEHGGYAFLAFKDRVQQLP